MQIIVVRCVNIKRKKEKSSLKESPKKRKGGKKIIYIYKENKEKEGKGKNKLKK